MEKVSTLELVTSYSGIRRDGNTTRLVDAAIQALFKGETVIVEDHHEWGRNKVANRHLATQILKRLANEHQITEPTNKIRKKYTEGRIEISINQKS